MIKLSRTYYTQKKQIFKSLQLADRFSTFKAPVAQVEGFKLISSDYSEDYHIQVNQIEHVKTGAKVYQLQNEDEDNTFAGILKTFPQDSKGTPHILEHLSCCGTQKYPIRDPFFNMLKRSVNTYMNAWTGEDFTCYPFSSANPKDYRNLLSVYSDMIFKPELNELDFMQQGWRYEIDQEGKQVIKGIVFNEMKGAYQSAQRQLMLALNEYLFQGTGYRHDSGGKPSDIVNLTYSELRKMHDYFYHPSNMSLFFYGNQDISQNLQYLNKNYLNNFQNTSQQYKHSQKIQPNLQTQHYRTIESKNAECNSISIFYYLKNIQELSPVQGLSLKILSYLMLEKNTSYVYENFIEKGIAQNIGFSGLNEGKLVTFGLTLKGVSSQYSQRQYENNFKNILQKILSEGLPQKRINEFIHEMQIGIKIPRQGNGIKILQHSVIPMTHRLKLINSLSPLKFIQQAKQTLINKEKLTKLINETFIKNDHFIVLKQLKKDQSSLGQSSQKTEENIVSSVQKSKEQIISQQEKLKQRQNSKQDYSVLPKLAISELIPRKMKQAHLITNTLLPSTISKDLKRKVNYYHVAIPQEINFYRFVFKFDSLPFDISDKIGIWNYFLDKGISTKRLNYKQLSSQMAEFTAGLSTEVVIGDKASTNIILKIACLPKNKNQLFRLVEEILFESRFEDQNVKNIGQLFKNEAVDVLTDAPIRECVDQCGSEMSLKARLTNRFQKVQFYPKSQIKKGIQQVSKEHSQTSNTLKEISSLLVHAPEIMLIQHSNTQPKQLPTLFERLKNQKIYNGKVPQEFVPKFVSKAVTHNFDVNFCSQQYKGPQFLSKDYALVQILGEYLQQTYLHPQIREKGGAYGARSNISQNGNIVLYSYMDPQSKKTYDIFDSSIERIKALDNMPPETLEEIKIKIVGQLERARVPQDDCVSALVREYSNDQYTSFIQTTKASLPAQIFQAGRKYFGSEKSRCMFGKDTLEGFTEEKLSDFI